MFLDQIRIKNIRCFRDDVCIDLPRPSAGEQSWLVILGDNGTGKTTLLRCIALGLCDETSASGLLREVSGEWIHHGADEGEIHLRLRASSDSKDFLETHTVIYRTPSGNEELRREKQAPSMPLREAEICACGYGASYGTWGSESVERYRLVDTLYTLFNYEARLQNPENALFRVSRTGVEIERLLESISRILMLPELSVGLDASGLQISGPDGHMVPAGSTGEGYAATISWLCDLFGWNLLAKRTSFRPQLDGLVLHDEIEKHLHPLWQRKIISLLASEFPGLQFIVTSHAPLIAIGAASLPDERCQLVLLEHGDNTISARAGLRPPRDLRADQVLTSYLFGLSTTSSDQLASSIRRYDELRRQARVGPDSQAELETLEVQIKQVLGSSETELEELVRRAMKETLARLAADAINQRRVSAEALDFETRRQLKEILLGDQSST